jgi:hypothetical protein
MGTRNVSAEKSTSAWPWLWFAAGAVGVTSGWMVLHLAGIHQFGLPGALLLVVFSAGFTVLARLLLTPSWASLEGRRRRAWIIACLAIGVAVTIVIPIHGAAGVGRLLDLESAYVSRWYRLGVLVASGVVLGAVVFVVGAWLVTRRASSESPGRAASEDPSDPTSAPHVAAVSVGRWAWLAFGLPPALAWSVYLLAFWPGVMSSDSLDQWGQILTGVYNDWHPVFHTLTMWLLTRLVESPAIVAATQIAVLSGVVGWALASMRRIGMSHRLAWTISGVVALLPANGITVITLWKDIPYAIGVLALGVILLLEVDRRHSLLDRRGGWAVIGAVAALVTLYHHAGIAVAATTLAALGLLTRRRAVIGSALLTIALIGLIQGGLYRLITISDAEHPGINAVVIHHLGAHLAAGTPLTPTEETQISQLIPIPDTDWYDCQTVNPFIFDPRFRVEAMHAQAAEARALWATLLIRNPTVDLDHLICSSSFVWRIRRFPGDYGYVSGLLRGREGQPVTIVENEFGLELAPVTPQLTSPLTQMIVGSHQPATAWIGWRAAIGLYLLIAGAAIATLRSSDRRHWAVLTPTLTIALILVVTAPSQSFRYAYPIYLSALILTPHLLLNIPRRYDSLRSDGTAQTASAKEQ